MYSNYFSENIEVVIAPVWLSLYLSYAFENRQMIGRSQTSDNGEINHMTLYIRQFEATLDLLQRNLEKMIGREI